MKALKDPGGKEIIQFLHRNKLTKLKSCVKSEISNFTFFSSFFRVPSMDSEDCSHHEVKQKMQYSMYVMLFMVQRQSKSVHG